MRGLRVGAGTAAAAMVVALGGCGSPQDEIDDRSRQVQDRLDDGARRLQDQVDRLPSVPTVPDVTVPDVQVP